jgi:hypothetical protein
MKYSSNTDYYNYICLRFVDRDMFIRFLGIGIGHRDQFIRSDSEVGPEADPMSNELCDEDHGGIEGEENDSSDQEDGNEEGGDEEDGNEEDSNEEDSNDSEEDSNEEDSNDSEEDNDEEDSDGENAGEEDSGEEDTGFDDL